MAIYPEIYNQFPEIQETHEAAKLPRTTVDKGEEFFILGHEKPGQEMSALIFNARNRFGELISRADKETEKNMTQKPTHQTSTKLKKS